MSTQHILSTATTLFRYLNIDTWYLNTSVLFCGLYVKAVTKHTNSEELILADIQHYQITSILSSTSNSQGRLTKRKNILSDHRDISGKKNNFKSRRQVLGCGQLLRNQEKINNSKTEREDNSSQTKCFFTRTLGLYKNEKFSQGT